MSQLIFGLNKLRINSNKRVLNIENVEFELQSGKNAVAIMGESGIGKTSIFKSLFRTYIDFWQKESRLQFECKHEINGITYSHTHIKSKKVKPNFGFATQVPYFDNSKSVKYNLFFPLNWIKEKWTTTNKNDFIDLFELNHIIDANMYELSGGQRQIINIARVFLSKPELVIIDECFSNINEDMARKYIDILNTNFGDCIFIITSHRKSDIDYFNAQKVSIGLKKHHNKIEYVSII